ncbi:hypothetical protein V2J09_018893 [Rumex salicifolius]
MAVNITSIKTSSDGIWEGEDPLHFAFPLLMMQTTLILLLTRTLAFLFKPLRQPKVIAEIVGGLLLGPSAFGRNEMYMKTMFPPWSTPLLESVASIGLLFFLFLVGLELDLHSIRHSGFCAFLIALAGISLPFFCGSGVAVVLRGSIDGADKVAYGPFLVFMGVSLSITAFPVLARILAELKLLTTRMGETAMAAAAFNDVAAWILLALAIALAGNGDTHKSPLISVWVLLSGVAFVVIMATVVRPVMARVARTCSLADPTARVDETCIGLTLAGVLISGFTTDLIGIHSIFGAFVFGLIIPKDGGFAGKLIDRIEDFVSVLLLPLYFASSGLKTNVATIKGAETWGLLVLVITTATAGKIIGTFVVAMTCRVPARESLTLGVLMNTKGLVELIVLNIGREKEVLNDEIFAILVLMALFTTFVTTPAVMAIYSPARHGVSECVSTRKRRLQCVAADISVSSSTASKDSLRILACLRGPSNVPATITLANLINGPSGLTRSHLKLYAMHLLELTERSSSIVLARRLRRNGLPFAKVRGGGGARGVVDVIEAYGQAQGRVKVRAISTISSLSTMHEDICHVAEQKELAMIVLPFHRTTTSEGDDMGREWRMVNQRVLKHAPCSVSVLVDRGLRLSEKRVSVGVVFFGGPDDREALAFVGRMTDHPTVKVVVIRFIDQTIQQRKTIELFPASEKSHEYSYSFSTAVMNHEEERALDEAAMAEFMRKCDGTTMEYTERTAVNLVEDVLDIGRSHDYDLIVVGRGRFPSTAVAAAAAHLTAEHPELGPIGDILASSSSHVACSVLVVQQHDLSHAEELPISTAQVGAEAADIHGLV